MTPCKFCGGCAYCSRAKMVCISCGAATISYGQFDEDDEQYRAAFVAWESGEYYPRPDQVEYAMRVISAVQSSVQEKMAQSRQSSSV